jgi:cyanophycinase-like exopeptidase
MMAEGYERGLSFLPGTAIDQHFSQRQRQADLTAVVQRFPQLLGIGIDEQTALIVRGQTAEVLGAGRAHFFDNRSPSQAGEPKVVVLDPGERYDLVVRIQDEVASAP